MVAAATVSGGPGARRASLPEGQAAASHAQPIPIPRSARQEPRPRRKLDSKMSDNNNQNECYLYGSESETPLRLPGYETDTLTDIFIQHLQSHVGAGDDYQPFFAVLSVQPPHGPYVAPTNPDYGVRRIHPAETRPCEVANLRIPPRTSRWKGDSPATRSHVARQ